MERHKTKYLAMAALCTALMAAGTYLRFPIPGLPVQFTTQTLFVLITALILPPVYSAGAIGTYVLLGIVGFPVFAQGGGPQTVLTPNFGYLLGFVFAAFITSWIFKKFKDMRFAMLLAAQAGVLAVYVIALPYAAVVSALYLSKPITINFLLTGYFLAFLPLDLAKAVIAAAVAAQLRRALK